MKLEFLDFTESLFGTSFLVHPKQIFGPSYFDSTLDIAMQHYILISQAAYTAHRRRFTSNIDHVTNSIPSSFSRCLLGYCHRSLHASNWFAREIIGCPFTLLHRGQVVNRLGSPHSRGRSQTTLTRRGRQVVQKYSIFVNVQTIENVNTEGQVVKKMPKSCQLSLSTAPYTHYIYVFDRRVPAH